MSSHPNVSKVLRLGSDAGKSKLLIEYTGADGSIYTKRIHVKKNRCMSADQLANELILYFPEYLSPDLVPRPKLLQAVRPIFASIGIDSEETSVDFEASNLDLNKVPDHVNQKAKEQMDRYFESKRLKPGDEGFEYDRRVDFVPTESNEWDEDE